MELRIRVGAAVDRSLSEAFRPLVESAEKAVKLIAAAGKKGADALRHELGRGIDGAHSDYKRFLYEVEKKTPYAFEQGAASADRFGHAIARMARRSEEELKRLARAAGMAEKPLPGGGRTGGGSVRRGRSDDAWTDRFLDPHRNANAAYALAGSAARKSLQIAGDVARGAGVRTDIGSFIGGEVDLERRAVDLSNAAYMPGHAGPNGARVDPNALIEQMRQVGNATAFDPNKAMEGLQKFVAKTGDLQTGRDLIADMARYARASGADLEDMVDAAGDVSNALGDVPNKGEAVKNVMRAIAAQGKEGAVEIKDLASQMAKLSAASSQFTGDPEKVMAQMGALVQMTRAKGGAASATSAATSVGSFTNTFAKGKRLKEFAAFGVDLYGADNKIDLRKVILGSIRAASSAEHGGMQAFNANMGKMFMDVAARRVTRGYETVFKEAGGGEAGLAAVAAALDDMARATMNETEIAESFRKSMQTTEAQVQVFNNEMSKTANELKAVLLPAFQSLGPVILDLTKKSVDWLAQITGTKQTKADTDQVNAEIGAVNAKGALGRLLGKQLASDDEVSAVYGDAAKAKRSLEAEIAKKAVEVDSEHNDFKFVGTGELYSDSMIKKMAGEGDSGAEKYLRDQEALARMKDTLEQLNRRQDEVADKIANKTLKVILVGDTRAPELNPNTPTRKPPPGAKGP